MKIKYSPIKWNEYAAPQFPEGTKPDTKIEILSANSLSIDGVEFEFDLQSVSWDSLSEQTQGRIIEAKRDDYGELWLVVRRFYTGSCSWDTGEYYEVIA
ncbi:MAG: hypothetical protein C0436_00100 [Alphaproteobacteria bacterium]|nr:hypothetical protein [Alphaproteobacteria bacterium]